MEPWCCGVLEWATTGISALMLCSFLSWAKQSGRLDRSLADACVDRLSGSKAEQKSQAIFDPKILCIPPIKVAYQRTSPLYSYMIYLASYKQKGLVAPFSIHR